jgi:hypothetical protein
MTRLLLPSGVNNQVFHGGSVGMRLNPPLGKPIEGLQVGALEVSSVPSGWEAAAPEDGRTGPVAFGGVGKTPGHPRDNMVFPFDKAW